MRWLHFGVAPRPPFDFGERRGTLRARACQSAIAAHPEITKMPPPRLRALPADEVALATQELVK